MPGELGEQWRTAALSRTGDHEDVRGRERSSGGMEGAESKNADEIREGRKDKHVYWRGRIWILDNPRTN